MQLTERDLQPLYVDHFALSYDQHPPAKILKLAILMSTASRPGIRRTTGLSMCTSSTAWAYRDITGMEPPSTPVSARTHTEYGLPRFDLYDEDKGDIEASDEFGKVKTIKEIDE